MPRYASNRHALGVSDRSGRAYPLRVMLKEWNGSLVGPDEYESKQPQIEPRRVIGDPEALRDSRPDRVEPEVASILDVPREIRFDLEQWSRLTDLRRLF